MKVNLLTICACITLCVILFCQCVVRIEQYGALDSDFDVTDSDVQDIEPPPDTSPPEYAEYKLDEQEFETKIQMTEDNDDDINDVLNNSPAASIDGPSNNMVSYKDDNAVTTPKIYSVNASEF